MHGRILPGTWQRPDNSSVRSHKKLVDAINRIGVITPGIGSTSKSVGQGTQIFTDGKVDYLDLRPGRLVIEGPASEPDFTNCQYWLKFAEIDEGNSDDKVTFTVTEAPESYEFSMPGEPGIVPVTNLAELVDDTHDLPILDGGSLPQVQVLALALTDSTGNKRWVIYEKPPASSDKWGKQISYTAGTNTVVLRPCNYAGVVTVPTDGSADVNVLITLPVGRTTCSIYGGETDDVLAYSTKNGVKWLASVPLPASTTGRDVLQIVASGQAGFDEVQIKEA